MASAAWFDRLEEVEGGDVRRSFQVTVCTRLEMRRVELVWSQRKPWPSVKNRRSPVSNCNGSGELAVRWLESKMHCGDWARSSSVPFVLNVFNFASVIRIFPPG